MNLEQPSYNKCYTKVHQVVYDHDKIRCIPERAELPAVIKTGLSHRMSSSCSWFTGNYPSPKACASLVAYKDNLVLFGGWSHPTPYTFHQVITLMV